MHSIKYLGQAGAVDEETFLTSFEDVPSVNLFSAKDLEEQMKTIRDTIGDDKKDWKQRTESVCVGKIYAIAWFYDVIICFIWIVFTAEKT